MPIFETFSKRKQKRDRQGKPDVYRYDDLPEPFRVQVIHIWKDTIGPYRIVGSWNIEPDSNKVWQTIHDTLARELGVFQLGKRTVDLTPFEQCHEYLVTEDAKNALDLIEIAFVVIDTRVRRLSLGEDNRSLDPDSAIDELNYRFREHSIGYQFVDGQLMKVDSQYVHAQIVQPALSLLREVKFRGADDEFLKAHEHYRRGRNKEAITEALKAFESTMKAIADSRGWSYPSTATAKALIAIMFEKGIVTRELESQFSALRSVLESGVPTLRNTSSAHGQGKDTISIPPHFAAYALHLAASNIVFLVEAFKAHK